MNISTYKYDYSWPKTQCNPVKKSSKGTLAREGLTPIKPTSYQPWMRGVRFYNIGDVRIFAFARYMGIDATHGNPLTPKEMHMVQLEALNMGMYVQYGGGEKKINYKKDLQKKPAQPVKVKKELPKPLTDEQWASNIIAHGYKKNDGKSWDYDYSYNAGPTHKPKSTLYVGDNDFALSIDRDQHAGDTIKAFYKEDYIGTFNTSFQYISRLQDSSYSMNNGRKKLPFINAIPKGNY